MTQSSIVSDIHATQSSTTLLDHVRDLVESEQGLTEALEKCQPLLSYFSSSSSVLSSQAEPPLLPTPRNMEEVRTILAVSRAYSLRTSAPPMWNPQLPVVGFATPNPLPHQLRGGALGAMQLKLAWEERTRKTKELAERREKEKRRNLEEEVRKRRQGRDESMMEEQAEVDSDLVGGSLKRKMDVIDAASVEEPIIDPKKRELLEKRQKQIAQVAANSTQQSSAVRHSVGGLNVNREAVNMNLSESSSSEEESDEDEE